MKFGAVNNSIPFFVVKSELLPHGGSVALRQLSPINKKGPSSFSYIFFFDNAN